MAFVAGSSMSTTSFSCSFKQNQAPTKISSLNSVSLSINGKCFPSLRLRPVTHRFRISCAAKPETVDKVCEIVRKQLALPAGTAVTGDSKFATLGADSLDTAPTKISSLNSVSLSINGKCFPSLRLRPVTHRFRISCAAKPETVDKVCEIVRKQLALPAGTAVTGDSKFATLGADSLDTVEIVMGLEEEFGISVEEESAQNIATVQDAADLIDKLIEKKA
ncbi:hypothetical protein TEA_011006 [Camellia sinensis var. sinensis]|uniref:Acyl carrier protein n=1 Tax=Camellia sinensis var. sinensis TaxID=542762 RepID=A0A4S4DZN9_CAMSN|nr:hypothetical protein TEA_011006 [Camellia sinensis var. sinensis]